jgi:pimeloyl-ACP methyl ester carboxylesterase
MGAITMVKEGEAAMPKVKVNDINIYYEVHGKGFPLVMIMGWSANSDWWDPRLIQELSKKYKLVMFDNRGAGRTDISEMKYSIKLFADDTVGLMDALGISRANIMGLSMGGMIAQELVLNYPEKVGKLVLCSTFCGGAKAVNPSQGVLETFMLNGSTFSPEQVARMTIPLIFTEDSIKNNPDLIKFSTQQILKAPISFKAMVGQFRSVLKFDTYDRLAQIKVPTLVLHGKQDILIPPENGSILAKAIPNAKLVYFENSAHGLVEDVDKVISVLLDFLG